MKNVKIMMMGTTDFGVRVDLEEEKKKRTMIETLNSLKLSELVLMIQRKLGPKYNFLISSSSTAFSCLFFLLSHCGFIGEVISGHFILQFLATA